MNIQKAEPLGRVGVGGGLGWCLRAPQDATELTAAERLDRLMALTMGPISSSSTGRFWASPPLLTFAQPYAIICRPIGPDLNIHYIKTHEDTP
jgi:hypothetical protein